jgi:mRNA degradation ribonuclease J1/J2
MRLMSHAGDRSYAAQALTGLWRNVRYRLVLYELAVDGLSVGEVTESSLKDRRILGEEGFVSVVIVIDSTHRAGDRLPGISRHRAGGVR